MDIGGRLAVTHPLVKRRLVEQAARVDTAEKWVVRLSLRLEVIAAVVFGSVARGDFNKWSDIDVLIVATGLPPDIRSRLELLMADTPPGVQPVGWTEEEFLHRLGRRDPIATEASTVGVVVAGELPEA